MSTFTPTPLDTTGVRLPTSLLGLMERLAENTHDVWAALRISQGWVHGLARDDGQKQHPCLVPYSDLPEIEKEYDRKTAQEVLKAIWLLGYQIVERTNTGRNNND